MSTFVEGEVVVRHLDDCEGMIRTRMSGAKADFSFDGRFLAFHAEKDKGLDATSASSICSSDR